MNIESLQIDKMLEWLKTKLKLDAMSITIMIPITHDTSTCGAEGFV